MPVPLALLQMGLGLAGAGVQYFGQQKQLKGQQADAAAALERERAASAEARAGLEGTNYDVAQSYRTMLDRSRQDPVADALRAQQQRREASNVSALQSGGARALIGGLGSVTQQSADAMSNIEADSFSRQQAALQTYGAQEQAAQDANIQKQLGLYEFDYGRAIGRGDEAETKLADVTAARQNLGRDTLSGLLGMAGQTVGSGLMQHSSDFYLFGRNNPNSPNYRGITEDQYAAVQPQSNIDFGSGSLTPGFLNQLGGMAGPGFDYSMMYNTPPSGPPYAGSGEKGMITPGEFSHDTNPIHMVKDGAKVGELTGGEVVLNPKQEKKVAAESPYFRALLKKFKEDAKKRKK